MSFRTRMFIAGLLVAALPLAALGITVRSAGVSRLTEAHASRIEQGASEVAGRWTELQERLGGALSALENVLLDDNRVRAAFRDRPDTDPTVQAAVERFGGAAGLDAVYVMLEDGRIAASSHFPGDAGRPAPDLAADLSLPASSETLWLGRVPSPEASLRVVADSRWADVAGTRVLLVVGIKADLVTRLVRDWAGLAVVQDTGEQAKWRDALPLAGFSPESATPDGFRVVSRLMSQELGAPGSLVLVWRDELLPDVLASFDRALVAALAGAGILAGLFSQAMSRSLVRPIERITGAARKVHLGKLDVSFGRGGGREFDRLTGFLNGMLDRLKEGLVRVKEAERRATVGELARQVNHDVRNGLVPIRNVVSHFEEARRDGPGALASAFDQRSGTLERSLAYLDELAAQYRAVAAHGGRASSDLSQIVRSVVAAAGTGPVALVEDLPTGPVWVQMDEVSLRRVVDNLVSNAEAAFGGTPGQVTLVARPSTGAGLVALTVQDDGPGIPEADRARLFEPFFTTKEGGTGLGLAIVRRLVADVGGTIEVESREGEGTRVTVSLPAAEGAE